MAEQSNSEELSEHENQQLLLLYQDRLDRIKDLKEYEWKGAYRAILLMAAIAGLAQLPTEPLRTAGQILACVGCILTAVAWYFVERALQGSLQRHRGGKNLLRKLFSERIREARPKEQPDQRSVSNALSFVVVASLVAFCFSIVAR